MRSFKGLLFVLLALAVVFTFGAPAWAAFGSQSGAGGEGGIQVVKDAPGTKYSGPLTINYIRAGVINKYDMHFFLRLKKGWDLYAFSGVAESVDGTVQAQQGVIDDFVKNTVIPILYPDYAPNYPEFWLKAVDNIVDNVTSGFDCCEDVEFTIMDVVISVQD
jgi:hypothetical protein